MEYSRWGARVRCGVWISRARALATLPDAGEVRSASAARWSTVHSRGHYALAPAGRTDGLVFISPVTKNGRKSTAST
jgi:hypothetical protein